MHNEKDILSDIIPKGNTVLLIVGESVGHKSAECGHYYSDEKNVFWELLSILIGKKLTPYNDTEIVKYSIGLTDIIKDKIRLEGVEPDKVDGYYDSFIKKVKEINPKIILFNSKFSCSSKDLTEREKAIRRKLKSRTEEFVKNYENKYIIKQYVSSSGSAYAYAQKRKEQWKDLSNIYKTFVENM